ncbi:MAG: DUF4394 domain-containing protein, partial [Rubrivivax sp.]|nr:DUF4394 domain-containing protein [Rubrivivax sp.]
MQRNKPFLYALTALAAAGLVACGGSDDGDTAPPAVAVGDTVVLTASGKLVSFNRASPATQVGAVNVSGLATGEALFGIDYRPADGLLYALASGGKIYTVDPATGVATLKTTLKAMVGDDNPYTALAGTQFGFDFNPVADRLRIVSNTGENLRVNVDTGDTITDGTLTPQPGVPAVTAAAYTNAFVGTGSTQLFGIDAGLGQLFLQDPPNAGALRAGVTLGVTGATGVSGFDIDARNNTGYAALTIGGTTMLYSINLAATATAASSLGPVAGGEAVIGLALKQPAAAAAVIGLTADARLVTFDPRTPNTLSANVAISGLGAGETVLGIDHRPSDGL